MIPALDAAGNLSTASSPLAVTIDISAPDAPEPLDLLAASDSGVDDADDLTNDTTPAFGASGFRLDKVEDIVPVLREALAAPGPAVVDAIIDPDDLPPLNLEATMRMGMG